MRIRTIKPDFWSDECLASLSFECRLLAIGLLNYADDEGYFNANTALIKAAIFPLTEDSLNIHGMLTDLSNVGYLALYEGEKNKQIGHIVKFTKHQKVNRPTASKYKALIVITEGSLNTHGGLTGGTGNREQGKDTLSSARINSGSIPPDWEPDEITQTMLDFRKAPPFDSDHVGAFVSYHLDKGRHLHNFDAAFTKWMLTERQFAKRKGSNDATNRQDDHDRFIAEAYAACDADEAANG